MKTGPDKLLLCPKCLARHRVRTCLSGNTFGAVGWTDAFVQAQLPPPAPLYRCRRCDAFFEQVHSRAKGLFELVAYVACAVAAGILAGVQTESIFIGIFVGFMSFIGASVGIPVVLQVLAGLALIGVPQATSLTSEDYLEALRRGPKDGAQERSLRWLAWVTHNHRDRDSWSVRDLAHMYSVPYQYGLIAEHVLAVVKERGSAQPELRWQEELTWTPPTDAAALSGAMAANLRAFMALLDVSKNAERLALAEAHRELGEYPEALALLGASFPSELAATASVISDLAKGGVPCVAPVPPARDLS